MKKSINVNIKKLIPNAVIPTYAHSTDVGLDLIATSANYTNDQYIEYGTGLAIEIPEGYAGLLFPRSSNSKKDLQLCNCVGIIDPEYRGEIKLRFRRIINPASRRTFVVPLNILEKRKVNFFKKRKEPNVLKCDFDTYDIGDKIAQLVIIPYPKITLKEVKELTTTNRGAGGFGSTGK